jgi:hypothetical protein
LHEDVEKLDEHGKERNMEVEVSFKGETCRL